MAEVELVYVVLVLPLFEVTEDQEEKEKGAQDKGPGNHHLRDMYSLFCFFYQVNAYKINLVSLTDTNSVHLGWFVFLKNHVVLAHRLSSDDPVIRRCRCRFLVAVFAEKWQIANILNCLFVYLRLNQHPFNKHFVQRKFHLKRSRSF